jgi:hypothetical protein
MVHGRLWFSQELSPGRVKYFFKVGAGFSPKGGKRFPEFAIN